MVSKSPGDKTNSVITFYVFMPEHSEEQHVFARQTKNFVGVTVPTRLIKSIGGDFQSLY